MFYSFQTTSVLAHKHDGRARAHLVLPTSPEEEEALPKALEQSLGQENEELFNMLCTTFNKQMALMSLTKGVRNGVHVQVWSLSGLKVSWREF